MAAVVGASDALVTAALDSVRGALVYQRLNAGHDANGNPLRLYVVSEIFSTDSRRAMSRTVAVCDEGYEGRAVVAPFVDAGAAELYTVPTSKSDYREWLRVGADSSDTLPLQIRGS